jgi:ribosomal protein S18 acetylase RimI-like enzyme
MLRNSPAVDRVESQLLLFNSGEFADLFTGPAFSIYPRLFLECPLAPTQSALHPEPLEMPPELDLLPWTAQDYQPAGELIHACYIGHTDAEINDQYRTLHGSLRFLHNIVRFPGCGTFEAAYSWTLRNRSTGALVGMVLCSRVAPDVAHITQLCIAPAYRGLGLGLALLRQSADTLRRAGFDAISLTVTEANQQAVNLYARFGFIRKHRFDAMSLNTKSPR